MKIKNFLYSILFFVIVLAVYCLLFLVIPFPKSASSWMSFGFTLFAICVCGAVFVYNFRGKDIRSKLYGFPILKVTLIYGVTQLLAGIVICVIAAFVDVPLWIPSVLYAVLLALEAVGFIATDSAKTVVETLDERTAAETETFAKLQAEIDGVIDLCTDDETCSILRKLSEKFRYSDPVSCPEAMAAESDLAADVDGLRTLVTGKDFAGARALADEIAINLARRNRICKMNKKEG